MVKPASVHYSSEQEEEEEVYGRDPGAQLFFMGFFKERAGDGGSGSIQ